MSIRIVGGVYLADTARVIGEVSLGEGTSVWYAAAIRGDVAPVTIGTMTNIQDGAVVHCDSGKPNTIGSLVTVGHGALVHGLSVGDGTLIGMGARVLGGTRIGARCLIAAGALVPPNMEVPDESVVVGMPGRIVRTLSEEDRRYLSWLAPHYRRLAERHVAGTDPTVQPWSGNRPFSSGQP